MSVAYEAHIGFAVDALADVATAVADAKSATAGASATVNAGAAGTTAAFSSIQHVNAFCEGELRVKLSSAAGGSVDIELLAAPQGSVADAVVIEQLAMGYVPGTTAEWKSYTFDLKRHTDVFVRITELSSQAVVIADAYFNVQ